MAKGKKPKSKGKKGLPPKKRLRQSDNKGRLRDIPLGSGFTPAKLPNTTQLHKELLDMTDVLMGRADPPKDFGHLTLMEVADAYFARASEMTMTIQALERDDLITSGRGKDAHPLHKFRTGELRTFMEMAKRAADLGSRRLTKEQLIFEQSRLGRESRGDD